MVTERDDAWEDLVATLSQGADGDDLLTWVPLPDAAAAAGVSRSTLRSWYRTGQLPSRLEPGPHGSQRVVPRELAIERALHGRGGLSGPAQRARESERSMAELFVDYASDRERRLEERL